MHAKTPPNLGHTFSQLTAANLVLSLSPVLNVLLYLLWSIGNHWTVTRVKQGRRECLQLEEGLHI